MHELEGPNDAELLRRAPEAKKEGADAIRRKYHDGAVSVSQVAPTPPPTPVHFYFDMTGTKYKYVSVRDGVVTWVQLESKIGALTLNAMVQQPLGAIQCYEITDPEEKARLERRCTQLNIRTAFPGGFKK